MQAMAPDKHDLQLAFSANNDITSDPFLRTTRGDLSDFTKGLGEFVERSSCKAFVSLMKNWMSCQFHDCDDAGFGSIPIFLTLQNFRV
jgi:hypothetical protein